MRASLVLVCALAPLVVSRAALAADPAAAQALFEQGKQLLDQKRLDDACRAFAESQRLDPGLGTQFHLADCEEKRGRTATAWASFLEVASEAKGRGEEARAKAARDRADALAPELARLTIDPGADRGLAGLAIARDDEAIGEGAWGVAMPIDPGHHAIVVTAPGHGAWRGAVDVEPNGRSVVTVPLLAPMAVEPTAVATTTSGDVDRASSRGNRQRIAGIALSIAGVAGAGVGTYFGLASKSKHDDAASHCAGNTCDPQGVSLRDDARSAGNASTVAFVAGGALLAGGLVTFFTAPHGASTTDAAAPTDAKPRVAISPTGVSLSGRW